MSSNITLEKLTVKANVNALVLYRQRYADKRSNPNSEEPHSLEQLKMTYERYLDALEDAFNAVGVTVN